MIVAFTQSTQSRPNGREASTSNPRASHQDRRFAPKRAKGASDGFSSTKTLGHPYTAPAKAAATTHMDVLPRMIICHEWGTAAMTAKIGQVQGAGRRPCRLQATMAPGISHHRIAGSTANGKKSQIATGGYSASSRPSTYGPASW